MTCPNGHESAATDYCDTCGATMDAGATTVSPVLSSGGAGSTGAADAGSGASASPSSSAPANSLDLDSPPSGSAARPCPNCGAPNAPDALFCEVCGYDHTTGTLPRSAHADTAAASGPVDAHAAPAAPIAPAAPAAGGAPAAPTAAPAGSAANAAPAVSAGTPSNPSKGLATPWVAELWIDPAWYTAQGSPDPLPSQGPPVVFALRNTSLLIGRASSSRGIHPDIDCGVDNGVSRRHAQLTTDGTRWWVEDLASSNGTYIGDSVGDLPSAAIPPGQKREVDADDRIYVGSWTRIVLRESTEDEISALA